MRTKTEQFAILCCMAEYRVIIPTDLKPSPAAYEISAATLLADYFNADVEFILRSNLKTPDLTINGVEWELKSPTGSGKYNVEHQIKDAAKQSCNVVFDTTRSKIHMTKLRHEVQYQFERIKPVKRLIIIDKSKQVIELFK